MHPFEKANLGKAPFRCTGVTKNMFVIPGPGGCVKPGSSCDFCGTSITYEYWIKSSDERVFKVGCDCVLKTHADVQDFKKVRRDFVKSQREMNRSKRRAEREAQWAVQRDLRRKEFEQQEPEIAAYLAAAGEITNTFVRDMRDAMNRWGSLTVNQVAALKRMIAQAQERLAEKTNSKHVGVLGKRHTGKFTVLHVKSTQISRFPCIVSYWHLMKDSEGNVCTYSGSCFLGQKNDVVEATFTVKEHKEYQGTAQTVLARPFIKQEIAA